MKRLFSLFIIAVLAFATTADARLAVTNLHMGKPAAGGAGTLVFSQSSDNPIAADQTVSATQTFSGVNIGTAASDRIVVAVFVQAHNPAGANSDMSSCSIAGQTTTHLAEVRHVNTNEVGEVVICSALVTSGTTGDMTITVSNPDPGDTTALIGVQVFHMTGIGTDPTAIEYVAELTDSGTDDNTMTGTINVDDGGAVVCGAAQGDDSGGTWTWAGATEISDDLGGSSRSSITTASEDSTTLETGRTYSATGSVSTGAFAMACISIKGSA